MRIPAVRIKTAGRCGGVAEARDLRGKEAGGGGGWGAGKKNVKKAKIGANILKKVEKGQKATGDLWGKKRVVK